jgi:hypothetical protein
MLNYLRKLFKEQKGMGTVEVIIIIAVLVGVALLFRKQLIGFVNGIIVNLFPSPDNLENNKEAATSTIKLLGFLCWH